MPRTIQIRDVDDDVYTELAKRAAGAGITVPELLRREVTRLASRPSLDDWLDLTRRRSVPAEELDTVPALDEVRGGPGT